MLLSYQRVGHRLPTSGFGASVREIFIGDPTLELQDIAQDLADQFFELLADQGHPDFDVGGDSLHGQAVSFGQGYRALEGAWCSRDRDFERATNR